MSPTRDQLAAIIDNTLLRVDATAADVRAFVEESARLGVYAVCVSPSMLPIPDLPEDLVLATVCGFPSGKHTMATKVAEAAEASRLGADEVDMVIDLGLLKSGRHRDVIEEIAAVRREVAVLKVIIESAALSADEIDLACRCAGTAGADFVKTSTGFHPAGGATVADVRLMADVVGGRLGVKASGGIATYEDAVALIEAGATRIGTSKAAGILAGAPE